jgi:hypothetical protein
MQVRPLDVMFPKLTRNAEVDGERSQLRLGALRNRNDGVGEFQCMEFDGNHQSVQV